MGQRKPKRARWTKSKQCRASNTATQLQDALVRVEAMASSQPERVRPQHSPCCFNMMLGHSERLRMIDYLWTGSYNGAMGELRAANPEMARWLEETTKNQYYASNQELHATKMTLKFESMLAQQIRVQNEHIMPLWTALHSIDAHRVKRDRCTSCTGLHLLAPQVAPMAPMPAECHLVGSHGSGTRRCACLHHRIGLWASSKRLCHDGRALATRQVRSYPACALTTLPSK